MSLVFPSVGRVSIPYRRATNFFKIGYHTIKNLIVSIPYRRATNFPYSKTLFYEIIVSIPYRRATNSASKCHKIDSLRVVSIPYRRATNSFRVMSIKNIFNMVSIPYRRATNCYEDINKLILAELFQFLIGELQTQKLESE